MAVFENDVSIYADFNGTTPVDDDVAAAINGSIKLDWGNPNSDYELGRHAKVQLDTAAERVANLINGRRGKVVFMSGGTEANNTVILGLTSGRKGCHVVTTNVEHPAVILPLRHVRETGGVEISEVAVTPYVNLVSAVLSAIRDNTVLVSVMAANNETGVLLPLREIGLGIVDLNVRRVAEGKGRVVFHSDAAQIIGKEQFDVEELNLDCVTIVGHKFYGPRIGALWTRVEIPALLFGGGCRDRPGTPNTPMVVGLGMAALIAGTNLGTNRENMKSARDYLEDRLKNHFPVKVIINCGELPRLPNTCNVSFDVQSTGKEILGRCKRILASVSAACHSNQSQISQVLINSGVEHDVAKTAIRLSIGRNATKQMMDDIVNDLKQAL